MDSFYADIDYQVVHDKQKQKKRTSGKAYVIAAFLFFTLAWLGWYTLRFIPAFDIRMISITSSGGTQMIPKAAVEVAASLKGVSLFAMKKHTITKNLESMAVIEKASIRRSFPQSVKIDITLIEPEILIAAVDERGTYNETLLIKDSHIAPIRVDEFFMFRQGVFVLEVSPSYASFIRTYGMDSGLKEAIRLASSMDGKTNDSYNLITKIKYDNNYNNGFGGMTLTIPSLNAQLTIRETVSEERIRQALQLIEREYTRDETRNIALGGQLQYDLYSNSLVKRQ